MKIDEVEGIGPVYAEKLAAGRHRDDGRAARAGRQAGRSRGASRRRPGSAATLILEWVNHVDLMRIKGVGSEYSDLLEAAGVDSPAELAHRNAGQPRDDVPGGRRGPPGHRPARAEREPRSPAGSPRRRHCPRSSSTEADVDGRLSGVPDQDQRPRAGDRRHHRRRARHASSRRSSTTSSCRRSAMALAASTSRQLKIVLGRDTRPARRSRSAGASFINSLIVVRRGDRWSSTSSARCSSRRGRRRPVGRGPDPPDRDPGRAATHRAAAGACASARSEPAIAAGRATVQASAPPGSSRAPGAIVVTAPSAVERGGASPGRRCRRRGRPRRRTPRRARGSVATRACAC